MRAVSLIKSWHSLCPRAAQISLKSMPSPPLYMRFKSVWLVNVKGPPMILAYKSLHDGKQVHAFKESGVGDTEHVYVRLHNVLLWGGSWGGYGRVE